MTLGLFTLEVLVSLVGLVFATASVTIAVREYTALDVRLKKINGDK